MALADFYPNFVLLEVREKEMETKKDHTDIPFKCIYRALANEIIMSVYDYECDGDAMRCADRARTHARTHMTP